MNAWARAQKQARQIGRAKTPQGKRRSVLAWCKRMREALGAHAD